MVGHDAVAVTRHRTLKRLIKYANGLCVCCAQPITEPPRKRIGPLSGRKEAHEPTIEHVFPLQPHPRIFKSHYGRRRLIFLRRLLGARHVTAAAHHRCNSRKGNRAPTGCEVIFLMAVQDRVKAAMPPSQRAGYHPPPMPPWAL